MVHKLQIKQRAGTEDQISTGMNTQVLLDGKPLKASFVKIEASARKVTKVLLEIYATVEADLNVVLDPKSMETRSVEPKDKIVKIDRIKSKS